MTDERRRRLALAIMMVGAALRTWQYGRRGALWIDEAAVARNVLARLPSQLLQPLDYAQLAPKGFLLATKGAVTLFVASEHALRAYAFGLSLLALPLFYRLAREFLPERAALVALGFFAVLGRAIFYASEAKQYDGDLFCAVLLLLLALPVLRGASGLRSSVRLGVAAAVTVWFSAPAIFVLAGIALALVLGDDRWPVANRPSAAPSRTTNAAHSASTARRRRSLLTVMLVCAASVIPAVVAAVHSLHPFDDAYMRSFWQEGFPPWPPRMSAAFIGDAVAWPFAVVYGLFFDLLGMPVAAFGVLLATLGAVAIWRRERGELFLLLGPVCAALAAGALRLYPFGVTLDGFNKMSAGNARVLLFLLPSMILLVVAGLDALLRAPRRVEHTIGSALTALTLGAPLYYDLVSIPYTPHDLDPLIAVVSRDARPGDRLYVYYGARQAFELYRGRFPFADSSVVRGDCHRPAWREYLRELDALRGRGRVWALMVRPAQVNGVREGELIDSYLGQIAPRLARWGQKDAYLSLYDMRVTRPMRGDPSTWHPAPRGFAIDTVALGFSCAGVFAQPSTDSTLTGRVNPRLR